VQPIVDTAQAASRLRSLASDAARRSRTAVLREVLPEIETAVRAGVSQVVILEELRTLGFEMSQSGFRSALRRLRSERPPSGRLGSAPMSTEFWSGLETQPAGFTATTSRGSLYDVEALSRLLMASPRTELDEARR
jgi:hypothetical protein